jgi:hypothetical protein
MAKEHRPQGKEAERSRLSCCVVTSSYHKKLRHPLTLQENASYWWALAGPFLRREVALYPVVHRRLADLIGGSDVGHAERLSA